jgi:lipopolysaccharide transport system ATP-binding protein
MSASIRFDHVSKKYRLHRPRSLRDIFLNWGRRSLRQGNLNGGAKAVWALRDVSFAIEPGQAVGLIGPNGAGKSTTFKLISGIIQPTSGRLEVQGRVAALLELGTGFHPELSGRDNIFLSGALSGMSRPEMQRKFAAIVDFSELEPFLDVPVKHYSSGMFARLAFAVSIHLDPEILLVDEVLAVGDQAFQQKCLDRIARLRQAGITICLVTHALETVRTMCARALWFDHGQVVADGAAEAVVRHYLDHTATVEAQRLVEAAQDLAGSAHRRWGRGPIEIVRVRLFGPEGTERTLFETGECVLLQIEYDAHQPIPMPVFGIAIHRQDGFHVSGPNTAFSGLQLPALNGRGTVRYVIPHLPLLEGLYHVSAAIVNQADNQTYDYHDRLYPFRVRNSDDRVRERYGIMTLQGHWEHSPAPELHSNE